MMRPSHWQFHLSQTAVIKKDKPAAGRHPFFHYMRDNRLTHICVALTTILALGTFGLNATSPDRPNIIFILADDMGYDGLSCYGAKRIKTPTSTASQRKSVRNPT